MFAIFFSPFLFLLFLCLLLSFSFPGNSLDVSQSPSSSSSAGGGFWISVELVSVEFRKGCISSALCHQPAFKLTQMMTLNGQTAVMSWPVEGGGAQTLFQKDIPRQFVSHWPLGDAEDVSISCQIAGTDPSFGFARTCDETPAKRLFQEQMVRRTVLKGTANWKEGENDGRKEEGEDGGHSLLVQMKGRCFNATLAVRKHIHRCPWCPDPNVDIQVVGGTAGTGQQNEQQQAAHKNDALELQNALILALSGAVVFSLTGLCCALRAHWHYRKSNSAGRSSRKGAAAAMMLSAGNQAKKKRILKLVSPPRAQRALPPVSPLMSEEQRERGAVLYGQNGEGGTTEEQRYDIPWDNKFCLVPRHWLANWQQQHHSTESSSSLAFSGGIEPLGSARNVDQYATCAEFCHSSSPQMSINLAARPPPPPPPPVPPFMSRHSQPSQLPRQFTPNTSGSSFGRHDDSGLDSV